MVRQKGSKGKGVDKEVERGKLTERNVVAEVTVVQVLEVDKATGKTELMTESRLKKTSQIAVELEVSKTL